MMQDLRSPRSEPTATTLPIVNTACELDTEGHCITCSDEALPVKIVSIDQASGLALVEVQNVTEEIDITLVDDVSVGDIVLVHGGVAIGYPDEA
jgi:hydrogenase assembly chaperone HypC/HupF